MRLIPVPLQLLFLVLCTLAATLDVKKLLLAPHPKHTNLSCFQLAIARSRSRLTPASHGHDSVQGPGRRHRRCRRSGRRRGFKFKFKFSQAESEYASLSDSVWARRVGLRQCST